MKNELVSKHAVARYSGLQLIVCEITNIVVPIVLGRIIDSAAFADCAKIILVVAVLELIFSIFIKSKRPENSGFDIKGFFRDVQLKGKYTFHPLKPAQLYLLHLHNSPSRNRE